MHGLLTWERQLLKACCIRSFHAAQFRNTSDQNTVQSAPALIEAPSTDSSVLFEVVGSLRALRTTAMKAGNSSSAKRIQKELAEISLDPPGNCSAGPKGDNIYEWVSTIMGPSGGRACRPLVPPVAVSLHERYCPNDLLNSRHRSLAPSRTSATDLFCSFAASASPDWSAMTDTLGAQGLPTQAAYSFLTSTSRQTIPSSHPRFLLAIRSAL